MKKSKFSLHVAEELSSARQKHGPMTNVHEGYAVILEELDEVWDEVKKRTKERNLPNLYRELVQVSAMAQKMAEDVVLPAIKNNKH